MYLYSSLNADQLIWQGGKVRSFLKETSGVSMGEKRSNNLAEGTSKWNM